MFEGDEKLYKVACKAVMKEGVALLGVLIDYVSVPELIFRLIALKGHVAVWIQCPRIHSPSYSNGH